MPFFDKPLEELQVYLPDREEPSDFSDFWQDTLAEARQYPLSAKFEPVDFGLKTIETYDVTFNGYAGQPIKGWLNLPRYSEQEKLAGVVEFIGYGGGRNFPTDWLAYSAAGYAHLIMDTRGQGSSWGMGHTPDIEPEGSNPQFPGFMTRGVLSPKTYYYRRLYTDAVRAVEALISNPRIDANRVAVGGASQGGGVSLAVSGLIPDTVKLLLSDVPFLCNFRRATRLIENQPYVEIINFCKNHRDKVDIVFKTLSYFDGMNFAVRAKAPALFSVGLMDDVCPPSTVFAAYNHYAGQKDIKVWEFNKHEGGQGFQVQEKIKFLHQHFA